jgi:hypothetical protein
MLRQCNAAGTHATLAWTPRRIGAEICCEKGGGKKKKDRSARSRVTPADPPLPLPWPSGLGAGRPKKVAGGGMGPRQAAPARAAPRAGRPLACRRVARSERTRAAFSSYQRKNSSDSHRARESTAAIRSPCACMGPDRRATTGVRVVQYVCSSWGVRGNRTRGSGVLARPEKLLQVGACTRVRKAKQKSKILLCSAKE